MSSRKVAMSIGSPSTTSSSHSETTIEYEDEDTKMVMVESPRPLTVSIPKNIHSPGNRRPNLSEILANTAPPPWTLSSFMAFLSQNHCLENLEFTMDASRYRKHYSKMVNRHPGTPISPLSDECAYVLMLWRRLIDAYIRESGPREVSRLSLLHHYFVLICIGQSTSRCPRHTTKPLGFMCTAPSIFVRRGCSQDLRINGGKCFGVILKLRVPSIRISHFWRYRQP